MLLLYTRTISYFFKEKIKGFEKVEKMLVLYLLICICTNTIYFINEYSGSYSPSPLSPLPCLSSSSASLKFMDICR